MLSGVLAGGQEHQVIAKKTGTAVIVGIWSTNSENHTNYSAARFFGDKLMLPAAGKRYYYLDGALGNRGSYGYYWSGTQDSINDVWSLTFNSSDASTDSLGTRHQGVSVRCVAE